jgi:sugar lactone lactonase YvrE
MRHNAEVIRYMALLLFGCASLSGQQYTISTLGGNSAAGVFLKSPTSVAVDSAGNVYVGDWSGYIHKIWAANGAVTVVAGTGVLGYGGDGGQATSANIGRSISLALDKAGNLYIADGDNNRIRRVELSSGIISAFAGTGAKIDSGDGGAALDAGVSRPSGITVDSAGNVYFGSSWDRVRKVTAASGAISTVAGQRETSFSGDNGPALEAHFWDPVPGGVDGAGNLYIADFENSRIRKVTASSGMVTTMAGSGPCAESPAPFRVMVCEAGKAGAAEPATGAFLNHAGAVALDAEGNLYISDTINHQVRRVDSSTGLIYTIAGNGVSGFSGDGGSAVGAEISFPAGIAVEASGKVYFADESNNRIRVLTPVGK